MSHQTFETHNYPIGLASVPLDDRDFERHCYCKDTVASNRPCMASCQADEQPGVLNENAYVVR